jgi:hypothetical protein
MSQESNRSVHAWTVRAVVLTLSVGVGSIAACSSGSSTQGGGSDAGNDHATTPDTGSHPDTGTGGNDSGNGGSDTGTGGNDSGTPPSDSGNGGGDTGTGGGNDSGNGGGDTGTGGTAADCATYCTAVQANCKGDNAAYVSMDQCMKTCAALPLGDVGDTMVDTVGCRLGAANAAKTTQAGNCAVAGPFGGDLSKGPTGFTCADDAPSDTNKIPGCPAFCEIAVSICPADFNGDQQTCEDACQLFTLSTTNVDVTTSTPSNGNTFNCRAYHLTAAVKDTATPSVHCGHIIAVSPTCG